MDFDIAFQRLGLAGRELGSGPMIAVERLLPQYADKRAKLIDQLERLNAVPASLKGRVPEPDHHRIKERAETILMGATIGLIMAEQPEVMEGLQEIEAEWLATHNQ